MSTELLFFIDYFISGCIVRWAIYFGEIRSNPSVYSAIGLVIGLVVSALFGYLFDLYFGLLDEVAHFSSKVALMLGFFLSNIIVRKYLLPEGSNGKNL